MVSRLDDSKIIDLFYERSEQAIIELSQKYGSVCTKVANNILNDVRDTEECVNDAYLGAWNTIPPQRPNPLLSYVCRIVRNLAIKKYHANTAAKRNSSYDVALDELENCFPASTSVEDEFNAGEIARSIDRFLETLDKENRIMFVRRYWHSDSIADLRQYAAEHGLTVVDEYIDDGWSGTNFERPSFQRMIDDIEDGKINCVVTKDLSRLGRNYILTGQYTEIYFPSKGVRYIAINDNVDTINGESELAPFLNILNEMHARQTSKKVKAAMHTRFANGAHYGAYAPLGYVKDPDKKGHLLIDPETRWIVEKIFDLAVHGRGAASITRILVEEKVPPPGWLNYERYGTFANIYAGAPAEKAYAWTIAQVKSILKEETYIGHSVHNKQSNISFKNKKKVRKPQEEWYRVENTHEAIISEEVFQKVQELIASRRRKRRNGTTQIFAGLIKCADCGWSLAYGENKQNKNPYGYYHCSKNGQGLRQCSMHYIRYDVLYAYVLARLQYWSMLAQKDEDKLLKRLLNASDRERNSAKKKQAAELKKAEKRKAEVDGLFAKMYEDWSAGRITEYNFNMLSEKYQNEQKELETKIRQLHEMMEAAVQTAADAEKWIALMKQYVNPVELTAELLNTLIEKITVHEAVKGEDGSREQEVEIYYRFIGKID
ncbi:recombinase family protein [Mediterraneibacter glycyrrhizinilyticus]